MELETAISPSPSLATKTLVIKSGILVPAARNVKPITYEHEESICQQSWKIRPNLREGGN